MHSKRSLELTCLWREGLKIQLTNQLNLTKMSTGTLLNSVSYCRQLRKKKHSHIRLAPFTTACKVIKKKKIKSEFLKDGVKSRGQWSQAHHRTLKRHAREALSKFKSGRRSLKLILHWILLSSILSSIKIMTGMLLWITPSFKWSVLYTQTLNLYN